MPLPLQEQHHLSLVAEAPRSNALQTIFQTLDTAKTLGVQEYDVQQTTLDDVSLDLGGAGLRRVLGYPRRNDSL